MEYIEVLDFWFGDTPDAPISEQRLAMWFEGGEEVDEIIRERFLPVVSLAGAGKLTEWLESPTGVLAQILLLDQFTRNIYRGLSAAFRYDQLALALCKKGLSKGYDQALTPIQRVFYYLPLEHSENSEDQQESLFLFSQLCEQADLSSAGIFENFYRFAHIHVDVIKQFGRFPYRNAVLGRLSTPEEIVWLSQGAMRFGQ